MFGASALTAFALWPNVQKLIRRRKKDKTRDNGVEFSDTEDYQEVKNYFRWKRNRTMNEIMETSDIHAIIN
jgi:hypothetical protein